MKSILLQAPTVASDTTGLVVETEKQMNVIDIALNGGIMLIPIVILSIIAIYLLVERYLTIKKAREYDPLFMKRIKDMVLEGNIKGAQSLCEATNTPIARMLEKGLSRIGKPLQDVQVAVQNVGNLEVSKLEKGMPLLATISGAAPMIGFLGTVIGMMRTFNDMRAFGVDLNKMSGGMMEAMVTTVAGLIVGIIAYASYNFLVSKMGQVIHKMEHTSISFLDILEERGK